MCGCVFISGTARHGADSAPPGAARVRLTLKVPPQAPKINERCADGEERLRREIGFLPNPYE